jgi:hypothetical protein
MPMNQVRRNCDCVASGHRDARHVVLHRVALGGPDSRIEAHGFRHDRLRPGKRVHVSGGGAMIAEHLIHLGG